MTSFLSHLRQILPEVDTSTTHHNPHATAHGADLSGLFRLLQDQMGTLAMDAPNDQNRDFLQHLVNLLESKLRALP
jgi:hypothetical protein